MDIKLKNKINRGILACIIVCLAASAIMLGFCPVYKNMAARYNGSSYDPDRWIDSLLETSYVLNIKAEEAVTGVSEDPAEIYIQGLSDKSFTGEQQERIKSLLSRFYSEYENWERIFQEIEEFYYYEVLDEKEETLFSNTEDSIYRIIKEGEKPKTYLILRFDAEGNMSIEDYSGINNVYGRLLNASANNPVEDFNWEYEEDELGSYNSLSFTGPKNRTFIYSLNEKAVSRWERELTSRYSYVNSGAMQMAFLIIALAVLLLALLLPFLHGFELGHMKVFKAPLEISTFIVFMDFGAAWSVMQLTGEFCEGNLQKEILNTGLTQSAAAAEFYAYALNAALWGIIFFIIYWAAACLRPVFSMGLWSYLKERSLAGRLWNWVIGLVGKIGRNFEMVDFREQSHKVVFKIVTANFIVLVLICSFWFFGIFALIIYSILLFAVLIKYYNDMQKKYLLLLSATNQIAEGNLDVNIQEELGIFEPFKEEIQKIQSGFKKAVEEEVKSQSMKTELITNVSHDLKTPLTAIITYVNLLKEENVTKEEQDAYIDILEKKSMRLKDLIEDLFEISKANSNNVTLNLSDIDIVSLLKEVRVDLTDKIEGSSIQFKWMLPEEKLMLNLDGQKMYRVFENLLVNIVKYSLEDSRAYISIEKAGEFAVITMKNISAVELDLQGEDFTERFVRGDKSRNTEGSGLGLAIAKSFVEVQGGNIQVETDGDLFKVIIRFQLS